MASRPFAIIAGVGSGTGSALARRFAQAYPVVLLARNPDNIEPIVKEINSSGGEAVGISADVSDAESVQSAFGQMAHKYGEHSLAAAVYNVGGVEPADAFFRAEWTLIRRGPGFRPEALPGADRGRV